MRPKPPVASSTALGPEDVQLAVRDAVGDHAAGDADAPPSVDDRSTTWYSSKKRTPCLMHCW